MEKTKSKIIILVGPTASGKSDLAVELALRFGGEVISADSRQVYKGMDVGSGKITKEEMRGVPHHLLDVADPQETYTGADFSIDAKKAIEDISKRNKLPIITGGTFFYIDLLRGKITSAPVKPDEDLRQKLEKLTTEELYKKLEKEDFEYSQKIDKNNRRRLIRALEIVASLGKVPSRAQANSEYEELVFGIEIEKTILHQRIEERLEQRLKNGMIEEVEKLIQQGVTPERLESFGLEYKYVTKFLRKEISYDEMYTGIINRSKQFAKRQYTWLKADNTIIWKQFPVDIDEIERDVKNFLSS